MIRLAPNAEACSTSTASNGRATAVTASPIPLTVDAPQYRQNAAAREALSGCFSFSPCPCTAVVMPAPCDRRVNLFRELTILMDHAIHRTRRPGLRDRAGAVGGR